MKWPIGYHIRLVSGICGTFWVRNQLHTLFFIFVFFPSQLAR
jgi:hypothetical protein